VSIQTVARSTEGAAGFSRERPQVIKGMAAMMTAMNSIRRISFRRATSLPRGTSMNFSLSEGNYLAIIDVTEK
jgi:hypothetical protein